ncbi:GNAT family N-acetyltransferase [Parafrankia sp. BMG5.11]|uniref:GNAT family N-acetyltransferase n=1 Tax=Parafrankia sp. BMG5.11 TaxID=222540 RepID=UPI001FB43E8F|nr:GNAT family N-acetyltransferase [Parafrankia sp. BMG5.11]CAI7977416.1 GCN5-related N-acetyltransferase [Frankia sp. Hr75.2]
MTPPSLAVAGAPGGGPTFVLVAGVPPAAVFGLRHEVFIEEQGVPEELERDVLDASADHAVLLGADGVVLATARLITPAGAQEPAAGRGRFGVVGRVAVRRPYRGRGLGQFVTEALEQLAAERGLTAIELHAQQRAEEFYRRAGYRPRPARFGPVRDSEAGIDHIWLRRDLEPGPRLDPGRDPRHAGVGELWIRGASPDALRVVARLGYARTGRERGARERAGAPELEYRRASVAP